MKETSIPCENKVFVNRTLNLNSIKLIGFDMDYTLATYNVLAFEAKAYEIVKEKLIKKFNYPEEINNFVLDNDFIIRGLVIDTEAGDFLKVNRYGFVRVASHGTKFYDFESLKKRFGTQRIDLSDRRYYIIHTLFSQAEGHMFAKLVDYYDSISQRVDYKRLFNEVRECVGEAHQDGELKGAVVACPEKYFKRDKRIVDALVKFKKFGKKIALITNSDYDYSRDVMNYCFGPYIDKPWYKFFDLVIVASDKPDFFTRSNRFQKVNPETSLLSNFYGQIEWGGLYQGGNAAVLEKNLNLEPSEILYLGDHIVGDVVSLKKAIGWRTGLIVQELADEVPVLEASKGIHRQIAEKMAVKESLEDESSELRETLFLKHGRSEKARAQLEKVKEKIALLDDELRELILKGQEGFNKYWGEVMRAGNEVSRFAAIVERYACVYMSRVANLSYYSPFKYFRSTRRLLAHDPLL